MESENIYFKLSPRKSTIDVIQTAPFQGIHPKKTKAIKGHTKGWRSPLDSALNASFMYSAPMRFPGTKNLGC